MKIITVGGKDYKLEFSFGAAENKDIVQRMFNFTSGAYILKGGNNMAEAVLNGTSDMISDIAETCVSAFHAGCIDNNPITMDEARELTRAYIKENKTNYRKLFEEIKTWMEEDGFFDLSGINDMLTEMSVSIEEQVKKTTKTNRKSTGTK